MNVALFSTFSNVPPGGVKSADATGNFVNFYKHPVLVEDIVFDWDWTVPARTAQTYGTTLGDAIRVLLKFSNNPITNGFIPVCLLARTENWRECTPQILVATQNLHTSYVWRFARPIWLPPNAKITVQIAHINDFTVNVAAANQTVDVTLRGKLDESDRIPQYVDVPYATAFLGAIQSNTVATQTGLAPPVTEQTAPTDLFNPFDIPLNVDRLQYEISVSSHGMDYGSTLNANFAPTDATSAQDQTGLLLAGQNYGLDRRYVTMKMTSSAGRALVKDYVPIGSVISSNSRTLDTKAVLEPKHYYMAFLNEQMPLFTDRKPAPGLPFQMRTGISLVGSRRLTVAEAFSTYNR